MDWKVFEISCWFINRQGITGGVCIWLMCGVLAMADVTILT